MVATAKKKIGGKKKKRTLSTHEKWWKAYEKKMYKLHVLGIYAYRGMDQKLSKEQKEKLKYFRKYVCPTNLAAKKKRQADLAGVGYAHALRTAAVTGKKPNVSDSDLKWLIRIGCLERKKEGKKYVYDIPQNAGFEYSGLNYRTKRRSG